MSGTPAEPGHEHCGARGRGTGKPCRLPAGWGTEHPGVGNCRKHLGNSPNHVTAAVETVAAQAAERFTLPVKTTARQALIDELARANGLVIWLTAQCQELAEKDELAWGQDRRVVKSSPARRSQQSAAVEVTMAARLHPLAAWLERERRHLAAVAVECERLKIDARLVAATEAQVAVFVRIMRAVLDDPRLALRPEQRAALSVIVPERTRQLTAVPDV